MSSDPGFLEYVLDQLAMGGLLRGIRMFRIAILLVALFLPGCATRHGAPDAAISTSQCLSAQERDRLLALDEDAFDQDLSGSGGGWRAIAAVRGCEFAAADLIRDYREQHASTASILYWHEGQMRATGGDYPAAIRLFEQSRKPEAQDLAGWNQYVDASIAFLEKDMPALLRARESLSRVEAPPDFIVQDGVFEIPNNSGKAFKMRWPPNIDVVDGLIKCFDRSYREAYDDATCRPPPPT